MKKLILAFFTFTSFSLQAGITSIGKGGGLGELQFIYYFRNIDQIISICEKSPSCNLTSEQHAAWNSLKRHYPNFKNKISISFAPYVDRDWSWKGQNLLISQQWLYQNQLDQLRSDAEIMSFALSIQLSQTQGLDFQTTYQHTLKSLFGLSFYNQSVKSTTNEVRFHWITLSNVLNAEGNLKLFVLEDHMNSYSLNALFESKSKELDINSIELYNVAVAANSTEVTVYGQVSGFNGKNYFNQRAFKFSAQMNNQRLILQDSIQLHLFLE